MQEKRRGGQKKKKILRGEQCHVRIFWRGTIFSFFQANNKKKKKFKFILQSFLAIYIYVHACIYIYMVGFIYILIN